jgi:RNA polymerase sigma factor (sigma-70 family)
MGDATTAGRAGDGSEPIALDELVAAWGESLGLDQRREIEVRITIAVRDAVADRVRFELARFSPSVAPSADDAVNQTLVELPTILAAFLESARRRRGPDSSDRGGFKSYLMNAARNVASDLAKATLREKDHLDRLARSHPSKLRSAPTTPSQSEMRTEIRELLAAELARFEEVDQRIVRRHAERADFAEIGRELGMPRETVRDRYHACAAMLRRVVERALGGDPFVSA